MNTLFEKQGGKYEMQGDYRLPCVTIPQDTTEYIGVWRERHRRFLKSHHRVGLMERYMRDNMVIFSSFRLQGHELQTG